VAQAATRPHKCNTKKCDQRKPVARVEDESDNSEYLPSDFEPDEVNRNDRECEDEVTADSSHNINTGTFLLTEEKQKGGSVSLALTNEHLLSVHEAFAGDDVVEEFVQEKEKETEKGKPKEVDLTLPGMCTV